MLKETLFKYSETILNAHYEHEKLFGNLYFALGFPGGSEGKASACNVGDQDSIPGSGRSPGERNDNPL